MAPVGRRVDPVAGEAAGERPRARLARRGDADKPVAADGSSRRSSRAPSPVRARRTSAASTSVTAPSAAGREVGDLHRRPGRRVLEHAGPAEVVEVVTGALGVRPSAPKPVIEQCTSDAGRSSGADAEPGGDAGPQTFEHDVRPRAERSGQAPGPPEVADDRLLAGASARPRPGAVGAAGRRPAARSGRRARRAGRARSPRRRSAGTRRARRRGCPSSGCVSACTTPILIES